MLRVRFTARLVGLLWALRVFGYHACHAKYEGFYLTRVTRFEENDSRLDSRSDSRLDSGRTAQGSTRGAKLDSRRLTQGSTRGAKLDSRRLTQDSTRGAKLDSRRLTQGSTRGAKLDSRRLNQVSTRRAKLDSGSRLKSQLEGLGSTQGVKSLGEGLKTCRSSGPPA